MPLHKVATVCIITTQLLFLPGGEKRKRKRRKGNFNMKKGLRFLVVGLLMVGLLILAGCGTNTAKEEAKQTPPAEKKVLKVGTDAAYAPFEFVDTNSKITGFDMDLLNAVAADAGYTVEYEAAAFDGLILSLQNGKYDAIISAMTITPERQKAIQFSDPYFLATQIVATKQGSDIKTVNDLKGKKVGVQISTTGQTAVEKLGVDPAKYDTTPDALNDLVNGSLNAVVADSPVVLYFIKQNPSFNLQAIQGDFDKEYYGIGMKLDNKELAGKINASLKKLMDNGTYNEIYKKWFNTDAPKF